MVVAREHDQRIGQQLLRHHVLHLRRVGEEIEVVLVLREALDQRLPVVGLHGGLDAGVEPGKGAEQPRGEAHARRAHGQPQPPGLQRAHAGKRCFEGREHAKDLLAAFVSRRPASVRYRRLPTCSNSGTPTVSESFLICTEAVGCAMCSSCAARVKLPSRAVASNRRSCGSVPCLR